MNLTSLTFCCLAIAGAVPFSAQSSAATSQTAVPVTGGTVHAPESSVPTSPATNPRPLISAQTHLDDGQRALAGISEVSLPQTAQKAFSHLLRDFSALASQYADAERDTTTWKSTFSDVERDLVRLIGGGVPPLALGDEPEIPMPRSEVLDPATRAMLAAFRTQVELFYDAAATRASRG